MKLRELIEDGARRFETAGLSFGHGTTNAFDEAAWLTLWKLGLPLDTALDDAPDSQANRPLSPEDIAQVATLFEARISSRKPAAYLTREAWLQGFSFYVDERSIVPRSLIAELLVDGSIDYWLSESTHKILDLCTGNGSLGLIAAHVYPDVQVLGADLSPEALAVAKINIERHGMQERMQLVQSDGLSAPALQAAGPFDLIVCNPPYVNADSMAALPPEYRAEPFMALDGNHHGSSDGMDFVRDLFQTVAQHMSPHAVLVLEIGHERAFFEAAFSQLHAVWLDTSAGADQVLLLTRDALLSFQ
ncbi:MAG: 50S ribosomal protein L3 N(5)-glutamine methyltransferase [Rhodoferax sp.]|nr:MAG: 50S ribosomal protein L3 N(5)-glutamine methyltransferase [Rhodoferax sp.]